jgi:hypothetical protein
MADRERVKEYDRGFAEAIDKVVLLLTLGVDFYPRIPSERTLSLLMDAEIARRILDCLKALGDRLQEKPPEIEMAMMHE